MAKNVNDPYSQNTVTPEQRGRQIIGGRDGNAFDAWDTVEQVACAHDQQAAPDALYSAPLVNNSSGRPSAAPVADRQADPDVERIGDLGGVVIYPVQGQSVTPKPNRS